RARSYIQTSSMLEKAAFSGRSERSDTVAISVASAGGMPRAPNNEAPAKLVVARSRSRRYAGVSIIEDLLLKLASPRPPSARSVSLRFPPPNRRFDPLVARNDCNRLIGDAFAP